MAGPDSPAVLLSNINLFKVSMIDRLQKTEALKFWSRVNRRTDVYYFDRSVLALIN